MPLKLPSRKDYETRAAWEDACWQEISKSSDILRRLVTPYERHGLVMRAAVEACLAVGKSYREIGRELWASPQTVSTIKKSFRKETYRSYFQRSKTERKKRVYSSSKSEDRVVSTKSLGGYRRTKYGKVRFF